MKEYQLWLLAATGNWSMAAFFDTFLAATNIAELLLNSDVAVAYKIVEVYVVG